MPNYCAIVPAAGSGSRFGTEQPKQYFDLGGRPLLFRSLLTLVRNPHIERVFVVLAVDDSWWERYDWSPLGAKLETVRRGGATRAQSVLAGLYAAETFVDDQDWVLVHDAARPCLRAESLAALIAELADDEVGGLLALRVADTLKRADANQRVAATPSREGLWQAQTPQMFRAGRLREALEKCNNVTDESSAIEALGLKPRLVAGEPSNLKVTYPADLALAALFLQNHDVPEVV